LAAQVARRRLTVLIFNTYEWLLVSRRQGM
jgi:hypothetical protein